MTTVCTLGDALLDVVVRLDEPLATGDDVTARTRTGAGGQAANVAAWAAALGGRGRCIATRAADPAGALVSAELERLGVELCGPLVEGRTGVVVSLVSTGGERTMASDRGAARELRQEQLEPAWLDGVDWLHVSGYALAVEPAASAAERAARWAARVSVDLSSETVLRDAPGIVERLRRIAPAAVFATEREREALGADLPATWIVKRGPRGIVVDGEAFPALPTTALDTTGAGDALAAGYLLGGPDLALRAAAECVATLGAMPAPAPPFCGGSS